MMGISMKEFLLIALVALVFIGPRELPGMMRTIARGFGMAQRAAREFHAQLDRMVRESEFTDLHRDMESLGRAERPAASSPPKGPPPAGTSGPSGSTPRAPKQGHPSATAGTDPVQAVASATPRPGGG
jgi:sec-independent protein translocase protein TatB